MADNVAITAGTGTTVATDDEGGVHYQKVKLIASVTGSTADLSRAEDAAHTSGDHGLLALGVRRDTAAASSGTDGDYEPFSTDSAGRMRISTAPANSGVDIGDVDVLSIAAGDNNIGNVDVLSVIPGTAATNLGKAIDAASAGTDTGVAPLAIRDDALAALVPIEGDYIPLRVDANGALWTSVSAALPAGTNAIGKLATNTGVDIGDVDVLTCGTVTPGTAATSLGKAEDAAHTSGDVGVMALATANEANTARAADGDYVPIATDTEGNVRIIGNRDHDAVDAGEVVGVGMRAIAHGTNPTAVAAADRTVWFANRAGVPFVVGGHPNIVTFEAAYTTAQTDAAIVTVAGGLKIVVTRISALCDNANTVDVGLRVGFGATTTPTTTGVVLTHPGIAAGSGVIEGNGSGIIGVGGDGEDLRITSEAPTTGSLRVLVSYYTIES